VARRQPPKRRLKAKRSHADVEPILWHCHLYELQWPPTADLYARYQDQEVLIKIDTGVVQGKMIRRALQMIFEWAEKHQKELKRNWELARARKPLELIPPLS
jgi:hypothetical protein